MLFQYISDLHLDHCNSKQLTERLAAIEPKAPFLIVAGDIGDPFHPSYEQFLSKISKEFKASWLITGNHEYYVDQRKRYMLLQRKVDWFKEVHDKIQQLCQKMGNVTFLNNSFSDLTKEMIIFGGTMWTPIEKAEMIPVQQCINDYNYIPGFNPSKAEQLHDEFIEKLNDVLEKSHKIVIVVTHHMPAKELIHPKYRSCCINSAFAVDVHQRNHPAINKWIYGHTHQMFQKEQFLCNPMGYPGESNRLNYNLTFDPFESPASSNCEIPAQKQATTSSPLPNP